MAQVIAVATAILAQTEKEYYTLIGDGEMFMYTDMYTLKYLQSWMGGFIWVFSELN